MDQLISPLTLQPVNLIQVAYLSLSTFGLILIGNNSRVSSLRIILVLVSLLMAFNLLEETHATRNLLLITPVFTLGFGPACYWFCRQLVCNTAPVFNRSAFHFLPMLLALPFTGWPQLVIAAGSLSQLIYLSLAIASINRYHRVIKQTSSDTTEVSIYWMSALLVAFLFMMLQDLVRLNFQPFLPLAWLQLWYFINTSVYAVLVGYLIVMAVHQPRFFNAFNEFAYLDEKAGHHSNNNVEAHSLHIEVDALVRTRQLYRQPRFSLRDLASETGIQEKNLSWIINQGAQQNFSEYINQLRVEAACEHLLSSPSNNLLDIAYAVGFNSKSTFNASFKKQTGMTPSQFAKKSAASITIQRA